VLGAIVCSPPYLMGRIGILFFDDAGGVIDRRALDPAGSTIGADFPPEAWHTLLALSPGSVFFETKAGPYAPPPERDLAPWSPPEGSAEAAALERSWRALFAGA